MSSRVRRSLLRQKLHLPTGTRTRFGLAPHRAALVEMEDVHFQHASAMLLPDAPHGLSAAGRRPTGLAIIAACLREAGRRPQHRVLVVGHADTSGPEAGNRALSLERADAVLHLLTGQREPWAEIVDRRHVDGDARSALEWIARTWGVSAFLRDAPHADSAMGTSTGTMTMWKRIDLEYRQMDGATHLPIDEAPTRSRPPSCSSTSTGWPTRRRSCT